ncbi:hypothetical protein TorRG33x02_013380 [Trema orientale]|uniref:Uncharacterized protein n=1 Tax=Trema orientale TaxID=63057 RepID=A0A2P5FZT3_TREOI|nr:hypothetical protein TorRG33x02_013380 [Trema orientale]
MADIVAKKSDDLVNSSMAESSTRSRGVTAKGQGRESQTGNCNDLLANRTIQSILII